MDKVVNHGTSSGTTTVPTLAMRNGDFIGLPTIYDPSTTTCTGTATTTCKRSPNGSLVANNHILKIDPVANALQQFFPKPNVAGTALAAFPGQVSNNYFFQSPTSNPFLKFFGRLWDWLRSWLCDVVRSFCALASYDVHHWDDNWTAACVFK